MVYHSVRPQLNLYNLLLKMLLKDNIQILYCMQFTGNCPARVLEFSSPIGGRTLVGHVFKTIKITSPDLCEVNCFIEADCVSFNVGPRKTEITCVN